MRCPVGNANSGRPGGFPGLVTTAKEPLRGGVNSQLEDSFHGAIDARLEYQTEQPWHRIAVFLAATGKNFTEIAERLGKSPVTVSQVLKQPWAQERLAREIAEAGRGTLQDILNVYGPQTLLEVVDLGKTAQSESVRLGAKKEILDRWLGKAKESLTITEKPAEDKSDDELRASVNTILNGLGRPEGVSGTPAS